MGILKEIKGKLKEIKVREPEGSLKEPKGYYWEIAYQSEEPQKFSLGPDRLPTSPPQYLVKASSSKGFETNSVVHLSEPAQQRFFCCRRQENQIVNFLLKRKGNNEHANRHYCITTKLKLITIICRFLTRHAIEAMNTLVDFRDGHIYLLYTHKACKYRANKEEQPEPEIYFAG